MKVREAMTRDVRLVKPEQPISEAAKLMSDLDIGALPVEENDRLVGMITDRDITVRATAAGLDSDNTRVEEVMTDEVCWCFEDDDTEDIVRVMSERQMRRIPVVNRDKHLVGIVALGDLATDDLQEASEALQQISEPSEPDRSETPARQRAGQAR